MRAEIYPLQMLLLTVSGWVAQHQADVIAYLIEEHRVLKEQVKGRALRLTDDQRRRLVDPTKMNLRMLGKKTDRRDAYELARRLRLGDVDRNAATYFADEGEFGAAARKTAVSAN